jgi:hypothetical protein
VADATECRAGRFCDDAEGVDAGLEALRVRERTTGPKKTKITKRTQIFARRLDFLSGNLGSFWANEAISGGNEGSFCVAVWWNSG